MTILQEREQKGIEEGIVLGLEQGLEQGIKQGKIEMAKGLIKEGVAIELVIKTSKLSIEEVEEIKREMLN